MYKTLNPVVLCNAKRINQSKHLWTNFLAIQMQIALNFEWWFYSAANIVASFIPLILKKCTFTAEAMTTLYNTHMLLTCTVRQHTALLSINKTKQN